MKWQACPERTNKVDCFADVETSAGTVRFLVRVLQNHGRDRQYVIRRNGKEIGRRQTLDKAKACAEAYSPQKQEGKAYAIQAIRLALNDLDPERHDIKPVVWLYLNCALDVLEGRVPRLAILPEITS